ncbi:hypothetical protein, variant [Aphanomyces invadans]|uniref:Serine/threonine-protein phosphatase n=1 Tax=Aphanomyces invadans TaxID=157072 RepID=A0A024U2R0_9STRA|nr:hypothetical protein, variant [Aphanomyces invadans]ETW00192.1 hypothetical protein, variant [Aphanomyces invadans]|eukprot:XP_008871217.1 hypothetical protein, variant [Aphanomyces invadans]
MLKRKRDDAAEKEAVYGIGRHAMDVNGRPTAHGEIAVGVSVLVFGKYAAVVRYMTESAEPPIIGVEFLRPVGNCDGTWNSHRFFQCKLNRGMFVRKDQVEPFSVQDAAACTLQAMWRRRKQILAFKTLVLTQTWNTLDNHQEQLNLKRAEQTKSACDVLSALAKDMVLSKPPLTRTISALPAAYDGPRLNWPLTLPMVLSMMEHFKLGHVMHSKYVMEVLAHATPLFRAAPTLQHIDVGPMDRLTIIGDLHGQLQDLYCILLTNGLPSATNKYLFNGDFVDRGHYGAEVVMILLCFKLLYPQGVFLNRGNHESRNQNSWMGFEEEILRKYNCTDDPTATNQAMTVLTGLQDLFDSLPLCALVLDRIFIVHGGLFSTRNVTLAQLNNIHRFREPPLHSKVAEDRLFEDMLWSDPRTIQGQHESVRGAGIEFGEDITNEFCSVNKVALVIRSHECVPEGYAVLHGGRLITLFSASKYCGTQLNKGAFCTLKADCRPEIQQFLAPPLHTYSRVKPMFPQFSVAEPPPAVADPLASTSTQPPLDASTSAMHDSLEEDSLRMIAERICEHKSDLFRYFTRHDQNKNGRVSRVVWADALKSELKLDLPFLLYQSKLVDVESDNSINYSKFMSRYRIENPAIDSSGWQDAIISIICKKLYRAMGAGSIEHAFQIFDTDASGSIEYDEFADGLKKLDTGLSESQIYELMRTADTNDDGRLDFTEFVSSPSTPSALASDTPPSSPQTTDMMSPAKLMRRKSSMEIETSSHTPSPVDKETLVALLDIGKAVFSLEKSLEEVFDSFDINHDGVLQRDEFQTALSQLGFKFEPPLVRKIMAAIDTDGGNTIDYKEFLAAFSVADVTHHKCLGDMTWQDTILQQVASLFYQHRIHIRMCFRMFDQDNSGTIDRDQFRIGIAEFNSILDSPLSREQIDALLSHLDKNHDGVISYKEFLEGFQVVSVES